MREGAKILIIIAGLLLASNLSGQEREPYRIEKLPVSLNMFSDIAPVIANGGILFCSDRKMNIVTNVENQNGENVYNIYYAERKDTMKWGKVKLYSRDLQSEVFDGPFCFTPDGNHIYFTRNIETGKRARRSGTDNNYGIFIADRSGDKWVNVRPFEHNDPLWKTAHPFISSDGRYLFFSSDMPGGSGGSDIYMCEWVNGSWSEPVNLGPVVNSPKADLYPYFANGNELYFSSDRGGGIGKLDIWVTRLSYGSWSKPTLLPEPLNSRANDFSLVTEPGSADGFFTSDRDRKDNLYRYTSLIIRKSQCDSLVIDRFCFEFIEEKLLRFDTIPYKVEWDFGDGTKGYGVRTEHCFAEAGSYLVKLNTVDLVTGEIEQNVKSHLIELEKTQQPYITSADTTGAGEQVLFDAAETYLPGWNIGEYYWNFDDNTFATGESATKIYSEPGVYNVQLIVSTQPGPGGIKRETCVSKFIVVTGGR